MTTEIVNYFIHFELMAFIGIPWIVFGISYVSSISHQGLRLILLR